MESPTLARASLNTDVASGVLSTAMIGSVSSSTVGRCPRHLRARPRLSRNRHATPYRLAASSRAAAFTGFSMPSPINVTL